VIGFHTSYFKTFAHKYDNPPQKVGTDSSLLERTQESSDPRGSLTSSTSSVNQLQEFGVDVLPGLLQNPDQLAGLAEVPRGEEGVGGAFVVAARRAADVVLR